jgi:hypothetical protein
MVAVEYLVGFEFPQAETTAPPERRRCRSVMARDWNNQRQVHSLIGGGGPGTTGPHAKQT